MDSLISSGIPYSRGNSCIACPSCEVNVLDMKHPAVAERAKKLGIRAVPAVVIDGKLADCCCGCGLDEERLKAEVLAKPRS